MNEEELTLEEKKSTFLDAASDAIADLCYYNRKNCELVSVKDVEELQLLRFLM